MNRPILLAAVLLTAAPTLVRAEEGKVFFDTPANGQGGSVDEETEPRVMRMRELLRIPEQQMPDVTYVVDSAIVFMHRCTGSSCTVTPGSTNSRTNRSNIVQSTGTLSAFSRSDAVWQTTMECMRETFEPFGVTITDVDPGPNTPHYEIMVGGTPGQLGFGQNTGGVSPFTCSSIPSSLVFVFDVWGNNSNEICSTAAQEVAHSWGLDHSTDSSDPMSYFGFTGRRHFRNAAVTCGSDCVGGEGPQGETCSGANNQVRRCMENCPGGGTATQNTFQMVRTLFGDGTPTPPTVNITKPMLGAHVSPGFPITADILDDSQITKVELYVDNQLVQTLTTKPFAFNGPDDLDEGTHTVKITGYDIFNTAGSGQVQVVVGPPCERPSDCPLDTDTCIGGRCVPGPGVQGGLGSTCTSPTECASGLCTMTTEGAYCVEQCLLGAEQCPDGFGCLDTGAGNGNGVCFPGYDDGGGGCASTGGAGPISIGLAFAALLFRRRRRS